MSKELKTGELHRKNNLLNANLENEYLDKLNNQINTEEKFIHRTILDHSVRDILNDFTNSTITIIDDIVDVIRNKNMETEESDDILDWFVNYMNIGYEIIHIILDKNNCLNIGILFIIISVFIHYFNISTNETK